MSDTLVLLEHLFNVQLLIYSRSDMKIIEHFCSDDSGLLDHIAPFFLISNQLFVFNTSLVDYRASSKCRYYQRTALPAAVLQVGHCINTRIL